MAKTEVNELPFLREVNSRSYRAFYKWGSRDKFYYPSNRSRLFDFVRDRLGVGDEFFREPNYAENSVNVEKANTRLDNKDVDKLRSIVGEENVYIDLDKRIEASITKNMEEIMAMHKGIIPPIVDAVVCPSRDEEIEEILSYAKKRKILVVVRSSLIPKATDKKCIALDLTKRYNKILEFDEVDGFVKVQAGMYLPILEDIMNNAPDNFKDYSVENKFTVGHFPMEYEECTIYDAASDIDLGQDASYYGTFHEIAIAKEYITADGKVGEWEEGAILSTATLRLTRYYPHNMYSFSYMFRNFQEALNALREIYSKNTAIPMHFKLSDPKETSLLTRYYMLDDTPVDSYLRWRKYMDEERCLLVGYSGGAYTYSRLAFNTVRRIARKYKGISMTSILADAHIDSRYRDMYVREAIADFGITTEVERHTLSWSEIPDKYKDIVTPIESGYTRSRVVKADKNGVVLEIVRIRV